MPSFLVARLGSDHEKGTAGAIPTTQSHGPHAGSRDAERTGSVWRSVVKISTEQLEKVKALGGQVTPPENVVDTAVIRLMDKELIQKVAAEVEAMPDRETMVADLKARIAAGGYAVKSDEIVDAMVRRTRADAVK